jgi:hypothetical protein
MAERAKYKHVKVDQEAALLWEDIQSTNIDRWHENIVPHEKSVLFGYCDVTLVIRTASGVLCPVKLRGIVVKSLKGNPHLDMPAEKGGDGEYYEHFMPRSAALRTVLTTLIFQDEGVQATIANATEAPADAPAASAAAPAPTGEPAEFSKGNPFAQGAS